jgi:hypothetical protein
LEVGGEGSAGKPANKLIKPAKDKILWGTSIMVWGLFKWVLQGTAKD